MTPLPRRAARLRTAILAWFSVLALAACGGGGGGVGGGGGGGGGAAPTVVIGGFGGNPFMRPGDTFQLAFTTDDGGTATVTVVLDLDGNLATTNDQGTVFGPVPDSAGNLIGPTLTVPNGLVAGRYTLFVIADDNDNPPVSATLATTISIYPGLAGIHPSAGSNHYAVVDGRIYFSRNESADGNQAFSTDGLADGDTVVARYDAMAGTFVQGAITVDDAAINGGESQIMDNNDSDAVAFETLEGDENADVDLDGTQLDRMATFWRNNDATPTRNSVVGLLNLRGMEGPFLFGHYREAQQGAGGTNRTPVGGDMDTADDVYGYIDTNAGAPSGNTETVFWPLAAGAAFATDQASIAAFYVTEAAQGNQDFSGDGDMADTLLGVLAFGAPGGTPGTFVTFGGLQAMPAQASRAVDPTAAFAVTGTTGFVAYYIDEAMIPGDPNLDGNANGYVPAFYDTVLQAEFIVPPPSAGIATATPGNPTMLFQNALLFFEYSESLRAEGTLGTNNDGDGGLDNRILCYADTTLGGAAMAVPVNVTGVASMGTLQALALDGGAVAPIAPTWLGVFVQEGANGNQDINANGVIDDAYLLVDTSVNPPVVHNPRLRVTPAGNIPQTGLGSDQGVLVRVLENLNGGDRDGDGNGAETLFTYIPFATPTQMRFLDAGGDYATIAGNHIAVTANETLTGEDYDGNGAMGDFVFRVFNLGGTVQHAGTLSHAMSVPATHTGNLWAFLRNEAAAVRDLNGDGDMADVTLGVWSAP